MKKRKETENIANKLWLEFARHPRLGEILIQHQKLNISQLGMALDIQKHKDMPIGQILIEMGIITKDELVEALELQLKIDNILSESINELKKLKDNEE